MTTLPARLADLLRRTGLAARRCPACGALIHGDETLCAHCAARLAPRNGGYCPRCGALFGDGDAAPAVCPDCLRDPPPWDHLAFYAVYADALRRLILDFKFHGGYHRARLLADLAKNAAARSLPEKVDGVVPVPLHRRRLAWRGFNQSTELGRAVARALNVPLWNHALIRTRHTRPQTRLDRSERRENIRNAFAADRAMVLDKRVLLVDDVYTTGSTLRECARTLKRAGAAGVDVLALARTRG